MAPRKSDALRADGALNPSPEAVSDPKFRHEEFFDPEDLVQVKYEMLRRVQAEGASVTQAATEYGFSRPTFYKAKANFENDGVVGLVPKKRGPHGPRKLRGEVLDYVIELVVPGQPIRAREIAARVQERFGIEVHPRTIERAVGPSKKK